MMNRLIRRGVSACIVVCLALGWLARPAGSVEAASPIVLDGAFDDWIGQPCIPDPPNDAMDGSSDILNLCFANNPDDATAYFMVERQPDKGDVTLWLAVDTNNNGLYQEVGDRRVRVNYKPTGNHANVDVALYNGTGQYLRNLASGADWGEGMSGGARVEWGVSFADLGIMTGQPIRMYVQSMEGNTVSDGTVEVQWSPADALGIPLLAGILLSGSVWFVYQRKRGKT